MSAARGRHQTAEFESFFGEIVNTIETVEAEARMPVLNASAVRQQVSDRALGIAIANDHATTGATGTGAGAGGCNLCEKRQLVGHGAAVAAKTETLDQVMLAAGVDPVQRAAADHHAQASIRQLKTFAGQRTLPDQFRGARG